MQYTYKTKVNWFLLIFYLATNKEFRWYFRETLFYALNNYNIKFGSGAADVCLFRDKFHSELGRIFKGGEMSVPLF